MAKRTERHSNTNRWQWKLHLYLEQWPNNRNSNRLNRRNVYGNNKDSKNCEITKTIEVIQPTILTATINSTDVNCNGEANGTATVTPAGGNGSYTYTWSNGQTAATATGLTAGTYTVTVKTAKTVRLPRR